MASVREDLSNYCPKAKLTDLGEDKLTGFISYLRDDKMLYPSRKKKEDRTEEDKIKPGWA